MLAHGTRACIPDSLAKGLSNKREAAGEPDLRCCCKAAQHCVQRTGAWEGENSRQTPHLREKDRRDPDAAIIRTVARLRLCLCLHRHRESFGNGGAHSEPGHYVCRGVAIRCLQLMPRSRTSKGSQAQLRETILLHNA